MKKQIDSEPSHEQKTGGEPSLRQKIDRELPSKPETACKYLYKDSAKYRTARDIWLCTNADRFSEISRRKGEPCPSVQWFHRAALACFSTFCTRCGPFSYISIVPRH